MTPMDVEKIFRSQQSFFRTQKTKEVSFRKENLLKLKNILKANEDQLNEAIFKDFSKSAFETYMTELALVYNEIDYFVKHLSRLSKPRKAATNLANFPGKSYIYSEPFGCTLIIGAWNYPYQLTLLPMATAMAAGNTCIVKPSELPENTMKIMAELINSNFPPEYLYVVQGGVEETTEILQWRFDKIFFTGSTRVGKIVYEAAAKNLIPVTLELGGKSPAIVTKNADLQVAAKRIVWGKFLNAGQTCVAPDYILVEEDIKDRFITLLKQRIEETGYEDGAQHYVKIINDRNFNRLLRLIDPSKVVYGGNSDESTLYIGPTVMDHVTWEDAVMQEEIFGPILPVITFKKLDHALEEIQARERPLSAYLFSDNKKEKDIFIRHIPFGGGCINDTIMHLVNGNIPFGGVGNSGIGNYHGKFGFDTFSHKKAILKKAKLGAENIKLPPYSESKFKWIKKLI